MGIPGPERLAAGLLVALTLGTPALAQRLNSRPGRMDGRLPTARVMPLGDSISHGGRGYVSYRYPLWFQLRRGRVPVDFVGTRITVNGGDCCGNPNEAWYPKYYTQFDRQHEAYSGWRTDEVLMISLDAAMASEPDIILIHLGTNDIGQLGAVGVANAPGNLKRIIDNLRAIRPVCRIALAQLIPIGQGSGYFLNAHRVPVLNAAIAFVAAEKDEVYSPVILVDQYTGYDLGTDMQVDGVHPNLSGEARMAAVWESAIQSILLPTLPPSQPTAVVQDSSFEVLGLGDNGIVQGPLNLSWKFAGTPSVQRGIFNPGVDSYLGADGLGTPMGAEGDEVAFLLNDGGASERGFIFQTLSTTLEPATDYTLEVAVGHRLATNPFGPSTWGGYSVELLAGNQVIASEVDQMIPTEGTFADVTLAVSSNALPARLLGQALTVRLSITGQNALDATDFDHVRLLAQ